ncbi:MAG: alpha/beta hydrolase [Clostridia bacterium]
MKKWLKRIGLALVVFLIIISILPFLIPIAAQEKATQVAPFGESEFVQIDGVSLHYRQWEPKQAEMKGKILLIHGLGGSTFSWRNNVDVLLQAGYLVVAVDLPGFGYSDRARGINQSQANRSKLLWELLAKVDAALLFKAQAMQWFLAGHSMGGGTATAMTIAKPERIKALILVDGALFDNNPGFAATLIKFPPVARWAQVFFQYYALQEKQIASFLSSAYGRAATKEEVQGYLSPLELPGTNSTMLDLVGTAASVPVEGLNKTEVPVIGIWGSKDSWVPVEQAVKIQKIVPRMTYSLIDGAVHCPMETHAAAFNQQLLQDLTKLSR